MHVSLYVEPQKIHKVKYDMILFEKIFCYFVNTFIFAVPKRDYQSVKRT